VDRKGKRSVFAKKRVPKLFGGRKGKGARGGPVLGSKKKKYHQPIYDWILGKGRVRDLIYGEESSRKNRGQMLILTDCKD